MKEVLQNKIILSASIACADFLRIGQVLHEIEEAGIQYIHCDIMDNHFVPNLMLSMDQVNDLRRGTTLPFDIHIMAVDPASIINRLVLRENDIVTIHYESVANLNPIIHHIRSTGAKVGVAINPQTSCDEILKFVDDIDMVLLMMVNPGFAGQSLVPGCIEKIQILSDKLDQMGYSHIIIEADGNCSFKNIPHMYRAGADMLVVGTSSVFKKGQTIQEGIKQIIASL